MSMAGTSCAEAGCSEPLPKRNGRGRPPTYCKLHALKRKRARDAKAEKRRQDKERKPYSPKLDAVEQAALRVRLGHDVFMHHMMQSGAGRGLPCARCGFEGGLRDQKKIRKDGQYKGRPPVYCWRCVPDMERQRKR